MARITVEECLTQIPNRFELTLVALIAPAVVEWRKHLVGESNDKPTVVALREISEGKVARKFSTAAKLIQLA